MQKILQNLLDLQNVDIRLIDVRARLAKFPKKIAESDARIAAAKADLDVSKAAQLATVKDRKKYELDVDSWKDKVRGFLLAAAVVAVVFLEGAPYERQAKLQGPSSTH